MACKSCNGIGDIKGVRCMACWGTGIPLCPMCGGYGHHSGEDGPEEKCGHCDGTGFSDEDPFAAVKA
jgi:hypothetical protein